MKFTLSTKPLKNVTDLGIIKANISKFYYRSNIVQLTANRDTLKINIEAAGIKTRMTLHGSGDSDTSASTMIDCAIFKNLIDSIENDVMTIEFIDGGIYIHAGTSKFAISQIVDVNDVQLDEPITEYTAESTVTINPADWQFIKDHQMYAVAKKEDHPIYKNVWVGANKDTIVGDYDASLFTYSTYGNFGGTCLFPASLINLFTSLPEGSTASKVGKSYILNITTDSYSMITEIIPKYEDDETVGSYNSEIILGMLAHPENFITLNILPISKFISQTSILKQSNMDTVINFTVKDGELTLADRANSYTAQVDSDASYTVKFAVDLFKSVISNFDTDVINVAPMMRGDMAIGCIFWTDTLTTLLAGQG